MYLKSIEMQGFKSFAEKIALDFHQGITAIVGPNGSGKSNISDAIRWVMGEQSAKSLRGGKMEDVIFSGTQSRKPLGFAEVSLCLDNSEKFFSLDFSEITVTRRVYRNGDSEYFINKSACRLKDIHELFMDTGLGREGYSIIGQGKIDNILSTKSEDRRQIFEEASGITKYKYRKSEAEKKLLQTQENLVRIKDILSELEGRLEPLKNQSERARKYLVLRDELKTLDVTVSINSIDNYRLDLKEVEKSYSIVSDQLDEVKSEIENTDKEISQLMQKLLEYDEEMEKCRSSEKQLSNSINESSNKINIFLSNIESNKVYIERLKAEAEKAEQVLKNIENNLTENEKVLSGYKIEFEKVLKEIAEAEEKSENITKEIEKYNEELENSKSEIVDTAVAVNNAKAQAANLDILVQNFLSRKEAVESELTEKSESYESLVNEVKALENANLEKEEEINNLKNIVQIKEAEYKNKKDEASHIAEQNNRKLILINQKVSQKNILEDMEKGFEGYAKSVKLVMNEHKDGSLYNIGIHAPLSHLISVDKKHITAIEVALGNTGQNIVVDGENDAKQAIEFLKSRNAGRATFLPISTVKGRSVDVSRISRQKGYIGVASELVSCDVQYSEIVQNVLGTTVIMDTFDNAAAASEKTGRKIRIVTLSGDIMQTSGAITGGSLGKNMSFLSRMSEIETLTKDIEKLKADEVRDRERVKAISAELTELMDEINSMNEKISLLHEEQIKISADYTHKAALADSMTQSREQLENEKQSIQQRISEISQQIEDKNKEIEESNAKIKELETLVSIGTDGFENLMRQNSEISDTMTELSIKKNNILKDIELQNERIGQIKTEKSETLENINRHSNEISEFEAKNSEMSKVIEKLREDIEKYHSDNDVSNKNLEDLGRKKLAANERISALQSGSKEIRDTMFNLQNQAARIEGRKSKIDAELESIVNRLWEDYELTYSDAITLKSDKIKSMAEARKRISEIRGAIKTLGNINVDAIEEYKEIKDRFDFLTNQTNDLESAKTDLEKVIADITVVMKEQFSEQFKVINKSFREVFSELFGGGRAELTLTDPANVLESGIEIEAQPPGKKLQNLTLLSGGERAFTAIALLFAILKVRPTPFCILDEIEAALDDVNVYRFAEFLKQYSKKTQFIVVTHRRGTMESANVLYGVTMQERGVSKLLSLNIDEVAK